jgi:hypothetical protein
MGRPRTKDFDLAPGWRRINGKPYYQPTRTGARAVPARERFLRTLPDAPIVYFVRMTGAHAVKIGFTSSGRTLRMRLRTLQTGAPKRVRLVGAVPGTIEDERRAHAALAEHRRNGEWFKSSEFVMRYLSMAMLAGRIPEDAGIAKGLHNSGGARL